LNSSSWTLENVVSAPHRPVPRNGRRYAEVGRRSWRRVTKYPSRNAPTTLMTKIAHGQLRASDGNAWESPVRMSAPTIPPAKIAPSSRRS